MSKRKPPDITERESSVGDEGVTWALPEGKCPHCGHRLDSASHMTERVKPRPGDLTICMACASVLRFDGALTVRQVSDEQLRRIRKQEPETGAEVMKLQRAILDMHAHFERHGFNPEFATGREKPN
jgi:hypothetical protein